MATSLAKNHLNVPASWDEVVSTGRKRKATTGMYAFADAAGKPGLTFVHLAHPAAQAGGRIYSSDAGTRRAFQFAHGAGTLAAAHDPTRAGRGVHRRR